MAHPQNGALSPPDVLLTVNWASATLNDSIHSRAHPSPGSHVFSLQSERKPPMPGWRQGALQGSWGLCWLEDKLFLGSCYRFSVVKCVLTSAHSDNLVHISVNLTPATSSWILLLSRPPTHLKQLSSSQLYLPISPRPSESSEWRGRVSKHPARLLLKQLVELPLILTVSTILRGIEGKCQKANVHKGSHPEKVPIGRVEPHSHEVK